MASEEDASTYPSSYLENLPELVVDLLLSHLPLESLLTLRLVSLKTKSWVESPTTLPHIRITITSEQDLKDIVTSTTVPWTNIRFHWDAIFIRPKILPQFLELFSPFISIFEFTKFAVDDHAARNEAIVDILLACENLRSIKLCELSCMHITKKNGLGTLKNNWRHLRHLSIQQMLCQDFHGLHYFGELLLSCENIEELYPPTIAISSPEYFSFNHKLYFKEHVVCPVIDLLIKGTLRKLHVQEHLFDGDPHMIFYLAEICAETLCTVHPETFLPFSRSIFLDTPESSSSSDIIHSLGRLGGINDLIIREGMRKPLTNLTFLSVSFRSFFVSEPNLYMDEDNDDLPPPPFLHLPKLHEVEMEMTNDPPWVGRPYKLSRFMHKFCSSPHPSVRKLTLAEVSRANDATMMRSSDIVKGFPYLTFLSISNWDAAAKDFIVLWEGLPDLENLHLRYCHHFGDDAVIGLGGEEPVMLAKLKNLKVLVLNDVNLTDKSFQLVFRNMKLRKLHHYCSMDQCKVTKKGYMYLATGPFRYSIQDLMIQTSVFKKFFEFSAFLQNFPKLRITESDYPPKPHHPVASLALLHSARAGGTRSKRGIVNNYWGHHQGVCRIM